MKPSVFVLMLLLVNQAAFVSVPDGCCSSETSASLHPSHCAYACGPLPFTRPRAATVSEEQQPSENASQNDRDLIINNSFNDKLIEESAPEGANVVEKAAWGVYRQLGGRDFYRPVNYMFFRQAVKEIGLLPAIFATIDRILRDSKIGTYDVRIDADHPVVAEGPEAYAPGRAGK